MTENEGIKSKKRKSFIFRGIYVPIIALTLVFSIIAYQKKSKAWFSSQTTNSASGITVTIDSGDVHIHSIDIYPVTEITTTVENEESIDRYSFVNEVADSLPRYDPAQIDYSEYCTAVVIKVVCNVGREGTYTMYLKGTDTTAKLYDTANCMSNISAVRIAEIDGDAPAEGFESALAKATSVAQSMAGSINATSGVVGEKLEVALAEVSGGTNTFWFIVEYDKDRISQICQHRMNDSSLTSQQKLAEVTYTSDLMLTSRKTTN